VIEAGRAALFSPPPNSTWQINSDKVCRCPSSRRIFSSTALGRQVKLRGPALELKLKRPPLVPGWR